MARVLKGGAPTAEKLPTWSPYTPDKRETMIFDSQSRLEMKPQETEYRLWDGVL